MFVDIDQIKQQLENKLRGNQVTDHYVRFSGNGDSAIENGVVWAHANTTEAWRSLVKEQKDFFLSQGKSFEWKFSRLHQPEALKQILRDAGGEGGEREELLAWHPGIPLPPKSVSFNVKELSTDEAMTAMRKIERAVYGECSESLYHLLLEQKMAVPNSIYFYAAVALDGDIAATGRLDIEGEVASLFGGATLPEHRRMGAFTSLVRARIERAQDLGATLVTVDASPRSLPILRKLGFLELGETTPFVFRA